MKHCNKYSKLYYTEVYSINSTSQKRKNRKYINDIMYLKIVHTIQYTHIHSEKKNYFYDPLTFYILYFTILENNSCKV